MNAVCTERITADVRHSHPVATTRPHARSLAHLMQYAHASFRPFPSRGQVTFVSWAERVHSHEVHRLAQRIDDAAFGSGREVDTSPRNGSCTATWRLLCVNLLKPEELRNKLSRAMPIPGSHRLTDVNLLILLAR